MAQIAAKDVKELRDRTLAGFADCKKALVECDGDMDKAADFLRKKGLVTAAKKAGRVAASGVVHSYIHSGGKIGVLVEVNCETDFVAKTDEFQEFVHDMGMQIAAMNPRWLTPDEVPAEAVEKEKGFLEASDKNDQGFFRSGKIGGFNGVLSKEQMARLSKDHQDMMERFGYGADGSVF